MAAARQALQLDTYTLDERIGRIYDAAVAAGCALALWQRPGMTCPQAVVDLNGTPPRDAVDFATGQPAFVFAPFVADPPGAALQLQADLWFDGQLLHSHNNNGTPKRAQRAENFFAAIHQPQHHAPLPSPCPPTLTPC
ncbi:MAG: hypothetical protein NTV69_17890 [Caldilinea sp.]|nr:hypothetical protein [Caldilinea sp.]